MKQRLAEACQLWVVSTNAVHFTPAHVAVVQAFVDQGNGLFLWGDNTPYDQEVNNFLGKLRQVGDWLRSVVSE